MALPEFPSHFNFARDVVDKWAEQDAKLEAMIWLDGRGGEAQSFTYSYFSAKSKQAAKVLQNLGAKKGDRMMILLPRIPAWWEISTAALRLGVVLLPCTMLLTPKDIQYRAQASGANILVGNKESVSKFHEVQKNCPKVTTLLQVEGEPISSVPQYPERMKEVGEDAAKNFQTENTKWSDPSIIYFTSGTTGMPKMGAEHVQAGIATGRVWLQLQPGKCFWNLSEQGWAKAAWSWFGTWNNGASLFIEDIQGAFSAKHVVDRLHSYPITTLCAPPTAYRQLTITEMQKYVSQYPPKALEHTVGAGEPLNPEVIKVWKDMTGLEIKDGYGQSETILICGNFKGTPVRPGSMGKPMPGVPLDVIDDNGNVVADETEGDIAVATTYEDGSKVMCIFDGYLSTEGQVQRKEREQVVDGKKTGRNWYVTGDRAYRDKDGYIWFVGRNDDVINSAGYRIGPFEVESTLKQHPAVVESAVVASPDKERGEVVKAFIVLAESYTSKDPNTLASEIQEFCKKEAAPYKYPRKVQFVKPDFLPKTISGKIRRIELRQNEANSAGKSKL